MVDEQQLLEVQKNDSNDQFYTTISKSRFNVQDGQYLYPVVLGRQFPHLPGPNQVHLLLQRAGELLRTVESTATDYAIEHGSGPEPEEMGYVSEAVAEVGNRLARVEDRLDEEYTIVESPEQGKKRIDGAPDCPVCGTALRTGRDQLFRCKEEECDLHGRRLTVDTLELIQKVEEGEIEVQGDAS